MRKRSDICSGAVNERSASGRPLLKADLVKVFGRTAYEVDPSRADVWVVDRATGTRRNLTNGQTSAAGSWCATWSPDGQHLAFLSTLQEHKEPRGGDNVRLYVWNRQSNALRRLGGWPVVTQTRYGSGLHTLDLAGPGSATADACTIGDENPPFVWLDAHRILVAALPGESVSGLLDDSDRAYRQSAATDQALRAGLKPMVSASGSGAERTFADANQVATLAVVDVDKSMRTDIASVPAYPFNGSLSVRVSPDARHATILATVAAIAPGPGRFWANNDGEWQVEKKLGLVDLLGGQRVQWLPMPDAARLPLALDGWSDDGKSVSFTARAKPQDKAAIRFSATPATHAVSALAAAPEASPLLGTPACRRPRNSSCMTAVVWFGSTKHRKERPCEPPDLRAAGHGSFSR